MPGTSFVSLSAAGIRLGERLVFPHISWRWLRTEQWAIVGANGAGKTLLGDALRGALPVAQGEVLYHFQCPRGLAPQDCISHVGFADRKQEVRGAVLQSRWNSLEEDDASSVREYLSYERVMDVNPFEVDPERPARRRAFEHRLRRAVLLLGIGGLIDRTLLALSNGERQKVQLAAALARPLRLLILDEPFAGLDAASRRVFRGLLERLMTTPLRVLLLTTRPEDLPRSVTHVAWVNGCRIAAMGKRKEVLARPELRRLFEQQPEAERPKARSLPAARKARRGGSVPHEALVELHNVTVAYGQLTVLNRLNWTVYEGESWAILGPNGSGKTTLLSLLTGDNPQAYQNDVTLFGRRRGEGDSIWELRRKIGRVSPELETYFEDSLTCFETVASGFDDTVGLFRRLGAAERKAVHATLARFRLLSLARTPLCELSGGLQRMALLARALVKRPRLLILDEPCQGLDLPHRRLFLKAVETLIREQAATTLFVTHRQDEIPRAIRQVLHLG